MRATDDRSHDPMGAEDSHETTADAAGGAEDRQEAKGRYWWRRAVWKALEERDREGTAREALKTHLDVFKHLTTLASVIAVALLTLSERFELTLAVALLGVVALGVTLLVCLFGIWAVSHVLRSPKPSNLAFWFSEALVGLACLSFFSALLTVLDGSLRQYGLGLFGWLRLLSVSREPFV